MKAHFILLHDHLAEKRDRSLLSRGKSDQTQALEGSLWYLSRADTLEKHRSRTITLHSHEFDGVILECEANHVERLNEKQFQILHALNNCKERSRLFHDKVWMSEAEHFQVGSYVMIVNVNELPEKVPGRIRYVGELPTQTGTWFGVELSLVSILLCQSPPHTFI